MFPTRPIWIVNLGQIWTQFKVRLSVQSSLSATYSANVKLHGLNTGWSTMKSRSTGSAATHTSGPARQVKWRRLHVTKHTRVSSSPVLALS